MRKINRQMVFARLLLIATVILSGSATCILAQSQTHPAEFCPRPADQGLIPEPEDLRSQNGVLSVELFFRSDVDTLGRTRYCYIYGGEIESPNLRLHPGDLLILTLRNELTAKAARQLPMPMGTGVGPQPRPGSDPCVGAQMTVSSTNLHFHGLTIPPVCHQDDVLSTVIQPSSAPFEYRFRIPQNQPSGLYWYHPHVHGLTQAQVLGGASGALIVEGIEGANREVAGLPERVLVIRDENLANPNAASNDTGQKAPAAILDRDGDARNTANGSGKPSKDLSINFVASAYPDYRGGTIKMKPAGRELWRVVNAASITYLNLQLLVGGKPQMFGVVAVDGAPVNVTGGNYIIWQNHLGVPPGGRMEFVVKAPPPGEAATLITRSVNTGPGGENDPTRVIAKVLADAEAAQPRSVLPVKAESVTRAKLPWLGNVTPSYQDGEVELAAYQNEVARPTRLERVIGRGPSTTMRHSSRRSYLRSNW
jgi:FtsP/CotA-like multicopper oxidase with cupredoxin domain